MKVSSGLKRKNHGLSMEISEEIIDDIRSLLRKINNGKCCIESIRLDIMYDDNSDADNLCRNISSCRPMTELSINNIESVLERFVEHSDRMTYKFFIEFKKNLENIYDNTEDESDESIVDSLSKVNYILSEIGLKYRIRQMTYDEILAGQGVFKSSSALMVWTPDFIVYTEE